MLKLPRFTFPAILIFIVVVVQQCAEGLYFEMRREIPAPLPLLIRMILFWAIGWWLSDDLRKRRESLIYCLGMVLWIAWPIVLPYYLFKTRGLKAFAIMAAFAGIWLTAAILGLIIAELLG